MTPERLAFLRGPAGGGRMLTAEECRELADAYEQALRALEHLAKRDPWGKGCACPSDAQKFLKACRA